MPTTIDSAPSGWPSLFSEWGRIVLADDFDAFARLLAPDVVVTTADGRTLRGPKAWIDTLSAFYALLGTAGQTIELWFADRPRTYGWRWRHTGTATTGIDFDLRGCTVVHFDGNQVTDVFSYADTAQLERIAARR